MSNKFIDAALTKGLRISHICWQNLAEVSCARPFPWSMLTSARFCQQIRVIPGPCFPIVFTSIFLDHSSLPPDFARRFVKSLALVFTWYLQAFSLSQLTSARFCQQICEIPSPCFHMVFTGILLDHSSLPPDFASRFVKSLALVFPWYLQAFCLITAHFRQILPADL